MKILKCVNYMIKLNLYNASQEFGVSRETLRKQLLAWEFVGPEFTIQQICKAVFNDLEAERTRNAKEDADKKVRDRLKEEGQTIDLEVFNRLMAVKVIAFKQFVCIGKLPTSFCRLNHGGGFPLQKGQFLFKGAQPRFRVVTHNCVVQYKAHYFRWFVSFLFGHAE